MDSAHQENPISLNLGGIIVRTINTNLWSSANWSQLVKQKALEWRLKFKMKSSWYPSTKYNSGRNGYISVLLKNESLFTR